MKADVEKLRLEKEQYDADFDKMDIEFVKIEKQKESLKEKSLLYEKKLKILETQLTEIVEVSKSIEIELPRKRAKLEALKTKKDKEEKQLDSKEDSIKVKSDELMKEKKRLETLLTPHLEKHAEL